jgi:hypothetical protein
MDANYYSGPETRELGMVDCLWCAEQGESVAASTQFDGDPCCTRCLKALESQAERQWSSREQGPSYADERAQQDELQRRVK